MDELDVSYKCPHCGKLQTHCSSMKGNPAKKPEPGYILFCASCGELSKMVGLGEGRPLTDPELFRIEMEYPGQLDRAKAFFCKRRQPKA